MEDEEFDDYYDVDYDSIPTPLSLRIILLDVLHIVGHKYIKHYERIQLRYKEYHKLNDILNENR